MTETFREVGFDSLLVLASGLALAAYALGVVPNPVPAAVVDFILVGVGVVTLVPDRARATAAAVGSVAVGLAGIVVPRAVASVSGLPVGNELAVTLLGSGLVLLATFGLLRLTAFPRRYERPA